MLLEKVKDLVDKRRQDGKIKLKSPRGCPKVGSLELEIWLYIKQGHSTSGAKLFGASDLELQKAFSKVNPNSVRYYRYQLEKTGFIRKTGHKRSIKKGGQRANVYEITDRWVGPKDVAITNGIRIDDKTFLIIGD
ncbi:MAG: hypothetical protein ABH849_00525 [Nanoarchaeota archaeon]